MSDLPPAPQPADVAQTTIAGERHVSDVAGPRAPLSRRAGVGVLVAGAALVCGAIVLADRKPSLQAQPGVPAVNRQIVAFEPPPLPPPSKVERPLEAAPPPLPPTGTGLTENSGAAAPPRTARLLVYTASSNAAPAQGATRGVPDAPAMAPPVSAGTTPGASGPSGASGANDLQARLTPTRLAGVSANVLPHQPYLLTVGTLMPCVLQTAMDSTLPGFVTCVIPQDIQGKTGMTLLDRGTKVVGEFQGGVRQGVERLFVVWTRAETPQGVVINLDSPATDPLGRSGLEGVADRHFWQRFGGALLLTTVDGAIQAGVAAASKSGTTTINTGPSQGIIEEVLRGSINIAPTVRKAQGELVSIFVARDLDFSTVYRLQPTASAALAPAPGRPP